MRRRPWQHSYWPPVSLYWRPVRAAGSYWLRRQSIRPPGLLGSTVTTMVDRHEPLFRVTLTHVVMRVTPLAVANSNERTRGASATTFRIVGWLVACPGNVGIVFDWRSNHCGPCLDAASCSSPHHQLPQALRWPGKELTPRSQRSPQPALLQQFPSRRS